MKRSAFVVPVLAATTLSLLALTTIATPARAQLFVPISATDTVLNVGGNWDDQSLTQTGILGTLPTGGTATAAPAFNLTGFTLFGATPDTAQFRINMNGWIGFNLTSPTSTITTPNPYTNPTFPTTTGVAIAPLWDDLYITGATSGLGAADKNVRANNTVPGQYTVTWKGMEAFQNTTPDLTFQATLLGLGNAYGVPAGTIVFSYATLTPGTFTFTATTGINATDGTNSLYTPGYTGNTNGATAFTTLQNTAYTFTPNGTGGYTSAVGVPGGAAVPEPGTLALLAPGLGALVGGVVVRRRKRSSAA